jgi:hypothetical protein
MDFFDENNRLKELSKPGDPLERLNRYIDWEQFRGPLTKALQKEPKGPGGRPPFDYVMMFKILVLQRLFSALQEEQITNKRVLVVSLDSTSVTVHSDAAGALKKTGNRRSGRAGEGCIRRFICRHLIISALSGFSCPAGRLLMQRTAGGYRDGPGMTNRTCCFPCLFILLCVLSPFVLWSLIV